MMLYRCFIIIEIKGKEKEINDIKSVLFSLMFILLFVIRASLLLISFCKNDTLKNGFFKIFYLHGISLTIIILNGK